MFFWNEIVYYNELTLHKTIIYNKINVHSLHLKGLK